LSYKGRPKGSYGQQRHSKGSWHSGRKSVQHDTALARKNFESRSELSQKQDLHRFATIAPNIHIYLKSPNQYDWENVDTPNILEKINVVTKLAKKTPVHLVVKDDNAKKTTHFKLIKKSEAKKEVEKEIAKIEQLAKSEDANNPLKEVHKLPTQAEILAEAQRLYMKDNGRMDYQEGVGTNLPERNELQEEGYLNRAKLSLMTSQDTQASRQVLDYVGKMREELSKLGFDVVPISGFDVSDLQY
jgi:hypothetical protein